MQIPGKLDERESIEDVARYLDNWFDGIVSRARRHDHMLRLAAAAQHPVINARTDFNHPCEILGDLAYIRARRGSLDGLKVAFVGEATNLCHPWFEAAARLPIHVTQICPAGYEASVEFLAQVQRDAVGAMDVSHDRTPQRQRRLTDCGPQQPEDHERITRQFCPTRSLPKTAPRRAGCLGPAPGHTREEVLRMQWPIWAISLRSQSLPVARAKCGVNHVTVLRVIMGTSH